MFLQLAHNRLEIYSVIRSFTKECYLLSNKLPAEERFNMIQQLRRAALSVHLNNAEGCSRKSEAERKRYFEISRGSIIEIDALLDIAEDLKYISKPDITILGELLIQVFKMLSGLIKTNSKLV
ncbi:MAG: four helix bundle protein [Bacteroidota bacterium]